MLKSFDIECTSRRYVQANVRELFCYLSMNSGAKLRGEFCLACDNLLYTYTPYDISNQNDILSKTHLLLP